MYQDRQSADGKTAQDARDLITAKKLALELKVSIDELILDEACRIFRLIMESGNQKK